LAVMVWDLIWLPLILCATVRASCAAAVEILAPV
jgi:hypothetical protein